MSSFTLLVFFFLFFTVCSRCIAHCSDKDLASSPMMASIYRLASDKQFKRVLCTFFFNPLAQEYPIILTTS